MFEELRGKTLLFYGAIKMFCEPIEIAKSLGITTIAIDYYENSPAKKVADRAFLVSTTDIDAVVELCRREKVDGIFTGFIDSMLPYAKKVCGILGLPFYATDEQIRMSLDKTFFKEQCRKFGISVPKDYYPEIKEKGIDGCEIEFPVIVKPIDNSGGRGITISYDKSTLKTALEYALTKSPSKKVIVEEYMEGVEICASYTMKNGEISLSGFKDKLLSLDHDSITSQGDCYVAPSRFLKQYEESVNDKVIHMLKEMKAQDGVCFFQGRADGNRIRFYEIGYRLGGVCDYLYISADHGIDFLKMMIAYSLTGIMGGYDLAQDTPHFNSIMCTYVLLAHGGTVGTLEGIEKVAKIPNVVHAEWRHDIGDVLSDDNTLNQRIFMGIIRGKNIEEIKSTILLMQKELKVMDSEGRNMLYKPFDVERLNVYDRSYLDYCIRNNKSGTDTL